MKFEGIIPALITPLHEDETINVPVLQQLVSHLLEQEVDGFYIGGATGEGIALKAEQRKILAETTVKEVAGRKPCIVHIASTDFGDALDLAKHAQQIGADGISAIPPLFFSYDEDDVYQYYKRLAQATDLPLMVYYNPAAGFAMNAAFAARLFEIDNVTAIKWTSSNYYEMIRLKDLTQGDMNIINGPDEMLLMGLMAGADGGIGTTYNLMPKLIRSIYQLVKENRVAEAKEAQRKADRIIEALLRYKGIPATKVILEDMGFAVGNAVFPMKRYTPEEKAQIVADVRNAGLYE